MTSPLADQLQREQVLDTTRSFIVQAPAGSGKTELLIQRYLALLSQSHKPESVLAITFTRKAAAEMRTRVLNALQAAQTQTEPPSQTHHYTRWALAKKLYEWQKQKGWNLLISPHRLQIQTIDAFYAQLVRKSPLQAKLHPSTQVTDQAEVLYREAVQLLLARLEEDSSLGHALISLARYLNNDHTQMERLLVHMLAHRDQWSFLVKEGAEDFNQLRTLLENSLAQLHQVTVQRLEQLLAAIGTIKWPKIFQDLLNFSYEMRSAGNAPVITDIHFWPAIADLLLTKEGRWRSTLTKAQGFPAAQQATSSEEKETYAAMKQQGLTLLTELKYHSSLQLTLHHIRTLPPHYYTDAQWSVLKSLFHVLTALTTFLRFVFAQHNMVDYIEISLSTFSLLGDENQPTEALLHLDYQIQHILIDEFQDTSLQQLRFLTRLTAGWEPHDKRTLFLVGDPMQSIYRFRKAEVRLFNMVQSTGIGHCQLHTLTLSTNFRSSAPLIQWVNHHFHAMSTHLNTQTTQTIQFVHSTPVSAQNNNITIQPDIAVQTHWSRQNEDELDTIVTIIKKQADAHQTLGILGRTRQHLLPIIQRLRDERIEYQAVEIETLADRPIIQDLLALTRALTHLGDEIAWMALLRAPWCGASLRDLHTIMQACQQYQPTRLIWDQLLQCHELPLDSQTHARIRHIVDQLQPIVTSYGRLPLKNRIKQAWNKLGGAAIQQRTQTHTSDIERFFECLHHLQVGETLVDLHALEMRLSTVYTQPAQSEQSSPITLMTMHKAKGLEFDHVILPSLHKTTRHNAYPLILFDEAPTSHDRHLLIASLLKTDEQANLDPVYAYLRQQDQAHHYAETLRLFYVACTRAKQTLHLTGVNETPGRTPMTGSLLYWLWPTLTQEQQHPIHLETTSKTKQMPPATHPRRLERMNFIGECPSISQNNEDR